MSNDLPTDLPTLTSAFLASGLAGSDLQSSVSEWTPTLSDSVESWSSKSLLLYQDNLDHLSLPEQDEIKRNSTSLKQDTLPSAADPQFGQDVVRLDGFGYDQRDRLSTTEIHTLIVLWLQSILVSKEAQEHICQLRGDAAKAYLDALQKFLDWMRDPRRIVAILPTSSDQELRDMRRRGIRLLISLSKASEELPPSLFIPKPEVDRRPGRDADGVGGYADIFKGSYLGRLTAFKRLRVFVENQNADPDRKRKMQTMLFQEALVCRQICHPSILPFHGVWREKEGKLPYLLAPWMAHGNAHKFSQAERRGHVIDRLVSGAVSLPSHAYTRHLEQQLIGVVEGLAYLHQEGIIHGDLTGKNILVEESDGAYRAQLCDFGLAILFTSPSSQLYYQSNSSGGGERGTIRWMAPETLFPQYSKPSFETDMYQFACVALELYSGQDPFSEYRHDVEVLHAVTAGTRPRHPGAGKYGRTLPRTPLWDVMEQCWKQTPLDRPTATVVLRKLQN
ncbi:hypothetical protein JAAARDRAFT_199049 [Jaapia argillacea MUCL 33604]|uniref:Protein kinase domain-containing protein n=1 Tax=Jaapia argillacea MUCL 33604 TaxID=933084 RepID=A0A067PCN6_9AGAM|nr:hypothetical protein JAAARDRAFT_199049 [Jaapia argillacea MUCL 33604]